MHSACSKRQVHKALHFRKSSTKHCPVPPAQLNGQRTFYQPLLWPNVTWEIQMKKQLHRKQTPLKWYKLTLFWCLDHLNSLVLPVRRNNQTFLHRKQPVKLNIESEFILDDESSPRSLSLATELFTKDGEKSREVNFDPRLSLFSLPCGGSQGTCFKWKSCCK